MFCLHCGKEIGSASFCGYCGGKMPLAQAADEAGVGEKPEAAAKASNNTATKEKSSKKKKAVIISAIAAVLVLAAGMTVFLWLQRPAPTSEALDLGERYLREANYEQALEQFLIVIEVEPENPRGYTGAAEAYAGLGDLDGAAAVLQRGSRALPGNSEIQAAQEVVQEKIREMPEPPLPTPEPEQDTKFADAYAAYYEVLKEKVDAYGVGYTSVKGIFETYDEYNITFEGVIYAELIDFDNDGVKELLFVWNDGTIPYGEKLSIYGYTDKLEPFFEISMVTEGGDFSYFEVATGSNGTYIVHNTGYYVFGSEHNRIYHTVKENRWVEALSLRFENEIIIDYDTYEHEETYKWFINGNEVSEQTYNAAPETELGITGAREIVYFGWSAELGTRITPLAHTVDEVLAELARHSGYASFEDKADITDTENHSANNYWKQLYIDLINENIGPSFPDADWAQYALLYIDDDDIPELIIERDPHGENSYAERSTLYTIYEREIRWNENIHLYHHNGLAHIERENLFIIGGGSMGAGGDDIYTIENGMFAIIHTGRFRGVGLPSDMGPAEYSWDGFDVSEHEYQQFLKQAFDGSKTKGIIFYDYNDIISVIEGMA